MNQDLFAQDAAQSRLRRWAPGDWHVAPDWQETVANFWQSPAGLALAKFVEGRCEQGAIIYPLQPLKALELTPLAQTRVVILGQDPYHGEDQAEGLAFSVGAGVKVPPSLRNIYKELQREGLCTQTRLSGSLVPWARQGVLLLNTCLTVEQGQPASHAGRGWEQLTDAILLSVVRLSRPVVFMLWGSHAQKTWYKVLAASQVCGCDQVMRHLILKSNHPSPLSALRGPVPFIGNHHFRTANDFLVQQGEAAVAW